MSVTPSTQHRVTRDDALTIDVGTPHGRSMIEVPQDAFDLLSGTISASANVRGFGGLHGGIGLAVAVRAIVSHDLEMTDLRSVSARYARAVRDDFTVNVHDIQRRGTVASARAELRSGGETCVAVSAIFGRSTIDTAPEAPTMPDWGEPLDHELFQLPPEFVPFGQFIEIRPTIPERPYAGRGDAHLAAWIRLRHDDGPIDLLRLMVLLDALAPAAAAPMTAFHAVPTVELSIRPASGAHTATSPWVLLDARSNLSADGWADETLTAWAPDGTHLASATQLRVVRPL